MKLGRTSFVHFISQVTATIAAFLATIYLARELGAEVLGVYYLAISLVSWLTIPSSIGIKSAISKRLSEQRDTAEYMTAGAVAMGAMLGLVVIAVIVARPYVNEYIGRPITVIIVALVLIDTASSYITAVLRGQHKVHIVGVLSPVRTITRSAIQIAAVFLGYKLFGILFGHAIGTAVAVAAGFAMLSLRFKRPRKRHFDRLLSFARYSWLGQIRSRTFNRLDVVVLGFFVSTSLIGVYSISWNVASFLGLFASSVSATLFPELSKLSARNETEDIGELIHVSISYAGLIHIPGLIGALLLGDRILRIYGDEFVKGTVVLVILILAYLIHSYNQQIQTALDAMDRPDLTFRANAALIISNVLLNIALVYIYGWIGAAVATTISMGISLAVGYQYLSQLVEFDLPVTIVVKQSVAGAIMGGVVFAGVRLEATYHLLSNNVATLLLLVGLGAVVYFLLLLAISARFRKIVRDNAPMEAVL